MHIIYHIDTPKLPEGIKDATEITGWCICTHEIESFKVRKKSSGALETTYGGFRPDIEKYSPLEYWIWKYLENPIKTKKFMIALSGEKEIGAFGLFSNRVKILDKIFLVNSGVDVGTHPDYRG